MKSFLFYILPVAALLFLFVNFFVGQPKFNTLEAEANHYALIGDNSSLEKTYRNLLLQDPYNLVYHYEYITTHYKNEREKKSVLEKEEGYDDDEEILRYYDSFLCSDSVFGVDIGHFGLALCYSEMGLYKKATENLSDIQNRELPYLNFLYGNLFSFVDTTSAEQAYLAEINNSGYVEGAYAALGELYVDDPQVIYALTKSIGSKYLSLSLKRKACYLAGDWKAYTQYVFSKFLIGFNVFGFAGAILILAVWLIFLTKIDFRQQQHYASLLYALVLGMIFAFLVSFLTDVLKYDFSFVLNGEMRNDFLYCIVAIGMVEELVKIIPFLIVLKTTKIIKEPIDYIVYASVCALGFSFIENVFYFDYGGLSKIQGRALSATVCHMFNTSIIAYFIVLAKNIKKYNVYLNFVIAFVVASLMHGFYDFWLLNQNANHFSFITFIQLLVSMFVWSSITNNCINNSSKFDASVNYDANVINDYLLYSLSFVFLFEYLVVAFEFGAEYANTTLLGDIFSSAFLLVFLAFSLSRFDIVKNYWAPIKFWDWNMMLTMHKLKPHYFNVKEVLGAKITLSAFRKHSPLHDFLPLKGTIISRELISWEKDWYLIQLEKRVKWERHSFNHVLVKVKNPSFDILAKKKQVVYLLSVEDVDLLKEKKKKKSNFFFLDFAMLNKYEEDGFGAKNEREN